MGHARAAPANALDVNENVAVSGNITVIMRNI